MTMAGGREYSRYQEKVIKRYYEHRDTIMAQKLGEIVTELYLAEGKKRDRLWERAEKTLEKLREKDARVRTILEKRDVEGLARLANEVG
jgi:hypothetical protein